ncbi:MAG: N-acetylornithine carbamoyltransferase [Bacteroidia bacterium]|nr:N-acetylornithine carbamoyltransferase [Bacteroidia bacterium]MCO5254292.1 N-acetylornithine carbamoyltransferase [Bacteroidota bacterium]MCZ2130179.1 N-acetylornithine carbamoyltransferase [Bacteroidia bacterium]
MKNFISVKDVTDIEALLSKALHIKHNPLEYTHIGKNKTIGLLFMNPSLRTRMSTQRAAYNLGMNVMVINLNKDNWQLEFENGAVMNGTGSEHIKEAAGVISQYCDIVGLRSFPGLIDRNKDYNEDIFNSFLINLTIPLVSLESATLHPLQSFADIITIKENFNGNKTPKVVLSWAPHIKPLPQAVSNSFAEWALASEFDFVITHPEGYELNKKFTNGATITHNQEEALKDADFVYVKSWSSYSDYGTMPEVKTDWLLNKKKMSLSNNARIMHCLPVRRNVELTDELIDDPSCSLIMQQAGNRVVSAQTILTEILSSIQ